MTRKWNTRFGIFAVFALLATMLVVVPAAAVPPVDTGATIGGGTNLPDILCKWELPDADPDKAGMQYLDDDAPNNDAGFPCTGDQADGFSYAPTVPVIQVRANPHDKPSERMIELWAAVVGPNGTDVREVMWRIYHPDESFKVQEHGTRHHDPENGPLGRWASVGAGNTYDLTSTGMWAAASTYGNVVRTGQIAPATVTGQWGLIAMENQNELELWRGSFDLSKHQPCGQYTVEANATSFTGDTSTTVNTLEVLCFINLEADFTEVHWGTITPGNTKVVAGDVAWNTPQFPTVRNTGSGAMTLGVRFAPMTLDGDPASGSLKIIDKFDAAFGLNASNLKVIDPIDADQNVYFGDGYYQTLCANEMGKLDLSIHPDRVSLIAGEYSGTLTLIAEHAAGHEACLNENGDWEGGQVRYPFVPPPT